MFLEKPSAHLSIEAQIRVTRFLENVLLNGHTVHKEMVDNAEDDDKENAPSLQYKKRSMKGIAPKVLFPKGNRAKPKQLVPESPHVYVSSPSKGATPLKNSPLHDLLSVC